MVTNQTPHQWRLTADELPVEGQLVEVPNNGGMTLRYSSGLWIVPATGMHIYFTPEFWSPVV